MDTWIDLDEIKWTPQQNLDCTENESWTPEQDSRPGQNTVSTVAPFCTFLRIENRAKIKRHVFCSKNLDFGEKTLKE